MNIYKLYVIKIKPIINYYINIYIEKNLQEWFELKYYLVLEYIGIKSRIYIYNIDKKRACLIVSIEKEVIVLIRIIEIYISIPENRLFLIVIKSISANSKAISPVVILPGKYIIVSWFYINITGYKIIIVSDSGYINKEIYII